MRGVVSLLDSTHNARVEDLWREFQVRFGVHGVHQTPFPHFSYHVAERYDLPRLKLVLQSLSAHMSNFHVKTAGLGIFTGIKPVLYIPVVRSPQLTELHREFWPEISKTASGVLSYYAPNMWMPHITIAQGDIDHNRLPDVMRLLSERDFSWDITIDNLAVIHDSGVGQTVKFRFNFG